MENYLLNFTWCEVFCLQVTQRVTFSRLRAGLKIKRLYGTKISIVEQKQTQRTTSSDDQFCSVLFSLQTGAFKKSSRIASSTTINSDVKVVVEELLQVFLELESLDDKLPRPALVSMEERNYKLRTLPEQTCNDHNWCGANKQEPHSIITIILQNKSMSPTLYNI